MQCYKNDALIAHVTGVKVFFGHIVIILYGSSV